MTPEVLNAIIVGGAVIFCVIGLVAGIIRQLGSVAALVLGLIAGRLFGADVAAHFGWNVFVCSAAVAIVVYIVVVLLSKLLRTTIHKLMLGPIDRLLGAVFGVILWLSLSSLALNLLLVFAPDMDFSGSQVGMWTLDFLPWVIGCAAPYI